MIFCSYRSQFDSSIEYLLFNLAKKASKYPNLQSALIFLGMKLFDTQRFQAIRDYEVLLTGGRLNTRAADEKAFASQRWDVRYDLFDLYGIDYVEGVTSSSPQLPFPKECTYIFKKSGFFSTIFTAISVSFFCKSHYIKLHLDWKNWPYDFDPSIFFESSGEIYQKRYSGQDILFRASREFLDSLDMSSQQYEDYRIYRKSVLVKLFNWCQDNLDQKTISQFSKSTACFIRRGDKLLREAYPISGEAYLSNLKKYQNVVVLGDDFYFDETLCKEGDFTHFYLDNHKLSGGDLSHVNADAVRSILTNYFLLCSSEEIIGDPYCNLFAAAMVYKDIYYSHDRNLHPWRLRKYI